MVVWYVGNFVYFAESKALGTLWKHGLGTNSGGGGGGGGDGEVDVSASLDGAALLTTVGRGAG